MKYLFLTLHLAFALSLFAQRSTCGHHHALKMEWEDPGNSRSDTLDILHTYIYLDLTQSSSTYISGVCRHDLECKMDAITQLHFDLTSLVVDSVVLDNNLLEFNQDGAHLYIQLPAPYMVGDLLSPTIYYGGQPAVDPSFGGFYTNSNYAYNLGVGFNADPHNFGRVWFPCFDNFVERSTYTVDILTNNGRTAYAGGMKTMEELVGQDSLLTRWELEQPIPSYLASVAASQYTHVSWEFENENGDLIPIYLASRASDTTNFKQSMATLIPWMHAQESHYGPYQWPRVGYVAVPFSGGAMEHATNIAYPLFAINGNLDYETLMAHEIAHHWWGDLVTCSTAEDMWLNEGWASFSEALYMESLYGSSAYINYVDNNHKDVLLNAHEQDDGRYPVSGVPHELTYGSHVYNKGALVAHSLRGYMGDEDFFAACKSFLSENAFSAVSSEDLRDHFQTFTTRNLDAFFNDWVFSEGDAEFRIRHWLQNGQNIEVSVEQFKHYNPNYYQDVPIQLSFTDWGIQSFDTTVVMSDVLNFHTITLPDFFEVKSVLLNKDHRLSLATLGETKVITTTGQTSLSMAGITLIANDLAGQDSIIFHCENHFATANEPAQIPFSDIFVSNDRWWLIDGDFGDAAIDVFLPFYGSSTSSNYYDIEFFAAISQLGFTENDLKIFYRPDGLSAWTIWDDFAVSTQGSPTNYAGRIRVNSVQKGQYCWGVQTGIVQLQESKAPSPITAFSFHHQVIVNCPFKNSQANLFTSSGELVGSYLLQDGRTVLSCDHLSSGTYLIVVSCNEENKSFQIALY